MAAEQKSLYKRVLLKISGESLMGENSCALDPSACHYMASIIQEVQSLGVQVGLVVGGGNIFRGSQFSSFGFSKTPSDHIGMLSTMINGLALQQSLLGIGCKSHVMSALDCNRLVEPYDYKKAQDYLLEGNVVIFVAGTGNPYFTTDTAAALKACEIGADVLIKGTKVDGVYDKDPLKYSGAQKKSVITYLEVLTQNLNVMDGAAVALCRDNRMPIHVINIFEKGTLLKALCEREGGSFVTGE